MTPIVVSLCIMRILKMMLLSIHQVPSSKKTVVIRLMLNRSLLISVNHDNQYNQRSITILDLLKISFFVYTQHGNKLNFSKFIFFLCVPLCSSVFSVLRFKYFVLFALHKSLSCARVQYNIRLIAILIQENVLVF